MLPCSLRMESALPLPEVAPHRNWVKGARLLRGNWFAKTTRYVSPRTSLRPTMEFVLLYVNTLRLPDSLAIAVPIKHALPSTQPGRKWEFVLISSTALPAGPLPMKIGAVIPHQTAPIQQCPALAINASDTAKGSAAMLPHAKPDLIAFKP